MRLAARRVPMLFVALLSMACGVSLGLVRLGWNLPLPWQDQLIAHGPLMVCGFLGTLISLERAVALGAPWGYAAPVLVASGALMLMTDCSCARATGRSSARRQNARRTKGDRLRRYSHMVPWRDVRP